MLDTPTNPEPCEAINPEGVNDLVRRWQRDHDERARDRLVRRYTGFITNMAIRLASDGRMESDDAIQEASIGFVRALETYDLMSGYKLATYASYWIRAKVGRARGREGTIHLPFHMQEWSRRMGKAAARLRRKFQRAPTTEEIAAELGTSVRRVESVLDARQVAGAAVSLNLPVGEDGDEELGDLQSDDEGRQPDVIALGRHEAEQARAAILQAAELLPERHRTILALRLVEGRTLLEVGKVLGVTRERVRQLEEKMMARMRDALRLDPRALALLGREVDVPETITRADADGLTMRDLILLTGFTDWTIAKMIAAGTFPAPTTVVHRGMRLWAHATVNEWLAQRAASAAETPSPGISHPTTLSLPARRRTRRGGHESKRPHLAMGPRERIGRGGSSADASTSTSR